MRKYYFCHILIIVAAFLGCAHRPASTGGGGTGGGPTTRAPEHPQFVVPQGIPQVEQPAIRIGIKTDVKAVTVGGKERTYFSDGSRTQNASGTTTIRLSFVPESATRYYVQLGSFSTPDNAANAQREFQKKSNRPTMIYFNRDLSLYQLRMGPFPSREAAGQAIDEAKDLGYANPFYVADSSGLSSLPELIVVNDSGNMLFRTKRAVYFWCTGEPVGIEGVLYRGYGSAFVNSTGRLTVINVLNMEEYLKGVVPNEIGPASASTYEALKAQAVAARTYAYKNLKQFDVDGYDICATARCQVYSGSNSENAMTSKAVEETKGEIITYQGEPINALYTSTCGGHTEDAQYMFEGWNYPYLKGVECYPEESETTQKMAKISGQTAAWWRAWLDTKLSVRVPDNLNDPVDSQQASAAMASLLRYLGKTTCAPSEIAPTNWITAGRQIVESLCWQSRRDSLLSSADYQYFLNHLDFSLSTTPETYSFLLLFHDGILVPADLTNFNPYMPIKRSEYFQALFQILRHYHQINPVDAQIREAGTNGVQVIDDHGVHALTTDSKTYVYQKIGDSFLPRSPIACAPGDDIEYTATESHLDLLVCELNQSGQAMDRSSKYSFWQEIVDPTDLGARVSKYLDVGEIKDLQPLSYGVSKRVYEMKVIGTKDSGTLKGIRIRWALGLKDNLFVIDRRYAENGRVSEFVFTGRGWGHGLGMCQIGALGYAKSGKDYKFILQHYYSGVTINRAY
jgi:peptidoglycan hydrolase-like amidase